LDARDIALIAVFAGITAALGFLPPIYVPISPAPITAQTLGVMLAGAVLGPLRGFLSQLLFQVLAIIGLPILSGGRTGLVSLASATSGFFIAFSLAALLIGWATYRFCSPYVWWKGIIINAVFGIVFVYILGITGMLLLTKLSLGGAILANTPYLLGDSAKAVLAAFIAKGVHAALPNLMPLRHPTADVPANNAVPAKTV
jgi:biotin transport system substrate-specific component